MKYFITLIAFSLALTVQGLPRHARNTEYQRVCYVSNWSQYRPGIGKYFPENVDPFLCTHIAYSFIEIGTNNELKLREWNDDQLIPRLMAWKQANPDLLVTAAVGGWNFGTDRFTAVCQDEGTMRHFASTSVDFLREWGFDGLDLDWEYPGNRGSPPEDKSKFTTLIEILLEEYEAEGQETGNDRLILTSAVAAGVGTIETAYEIAEICDLLDLVHIMTYDFHGGSWDNVTGHNAPLRGHTGFPGLEQFNVEDAVDIWLDGGCPADKLIMGVATYGRTFTLADQTDYGYNVTATGPGDAGPETREAGFLAYYEICRHIPGSTMVWNNETAAPAIVYGDQWVAYDDEDSLITKIDFMKQKGLGGIMVWALDNDDFTGEVCGAGEKYPLLRTIYRELEGMNSPACFVSPTTTVVTWWPPAETPTPQPCTTTCWYDEGEQLTCPPTTPPTTPPPPPTTEPCVGDCTTPTTTTTTTTPIPTVPGEGFCFNKPDGNYADPDDCYMFHQCAGGEDTPMQCSSGTCYNGNICDWETNENCNC